MSGFLTTLKPGDKALLLDGYHLSTIGEFKLPTKAAYQTPKAILRANSRAVGTLIRFAKRSNATDTTNDVLRIPQLLRHIAENMVSAEKLDIILLGSPFYADPEFSMTDGQIPSDGHLQASRSESPFGTADNPALLKGLRVHLSFGGEHIMQSDKHRYFIKRFWFLFITKQQGQLVSFTADLPTVFNKVRSRSALLVEKYTLAPSKKLEMISLRPVQTGKGIFERTLTKKTLAPALQRKAENVEIGLSWDCVSCDLDLYARPFPGLKALYYNHTSSPEGRYWKDYLQSGGNRQGYEIIAFNVPLDLQALQIAVNFYSGSAPQGVSGILRLSASGQTFAVPFHLSAKKGNKGGGINDAFNTGTPPNQQTLIFNPLHLVGGK